MSNGNRKIYFNKPDTESEKIAAGKNFEQLLESYQKVAGKSEGISSSYKTGGLAKIGIITLSVLVIGLIVSIFMARKLEKLEKVTENKIYPEETSTINSTKKHTLNEKINATEEAEEVYSRAHVKHVNEKENSAENNISDKKAVTQTTGTVPSNEQREGEVNNVENKKSGSVNNIKKRARNVNKKVQETSNGLQVKNSTKPSHHKNIVTTNKTENPTLAKGKSKENKNALRKETISKTNNNSQYPPKLSDIIINNEYKTNTKDNSTVAFAEKVVPMERKNFTISNAMEQAPVSSKTQEIELAKYKRRRDFDPKYTIGVKGSGFSSIYKLESRSKLYSGPQWVESFFFSDDSTVYSTTITTSFLSGYNVGASGSLRLFKRCYAEVDMSYLRRYFVTQTYTSSRGAPPGPPKNVILNNIQADLGISYWFGKENFEFGINPGISKRLVNNTKSSYLHVENKDEDKYTIAAATKFPLSAYSWYSKISFRYNFNRTQIRLDLGMHQNDLLVDGNFYETISTSVGVYYKLY